MKIIKDPFDINEIINVLKADGLVIFPTETVYGIGADATNSKAIKKLNRYKQRPPGKPYSIAVSSQKMAEKFAEINSTAKNIYKEFLPGPVTVVSKGKGKLAPGVESETGTLGIRIPDHPLVIKIIEKLGAPITATSANASYKKRPYKIADILNNVSNKQWGLIDLIIDAGELAHNEPSTVIDTTLDDLVVLRQGNIKFKNKNEVLSRGEENTQNIAKELWQKYEEFAGKRAIVYALEGQMGAGKTQFVKGLARAMGIKEEILSPTYDLLLSHQTPAGRPAGLTIGHQLVHIDTWRMVDPTEEIKNLRTKELIDNKSVIAIEWAEKVADVIRSYTDDAIIIWIKIRYGEKENERLISWDVI